eukprot:TRINITY_DN2965_c0_g1_i9.p1 TRINITY_DN2965_c0_g1~~TRINITY_DN2965_c0_g1_i9.p1  ORF type:complete len:277 (-),score=68.86 TRINITY_DN2965_c0_g1_i9:136-966(-)
MELDSSVSLMDTEVLVWFSVGQEVAAFARKHLPAAVKSSGAFKAKNYKQALVDGFLSIDRQLETEKGRKELYGMYQESGRKDLKDVTPETLPKLMGCTACVALITKTEIYVANVGDSRAVLCRKGKAIEMSEDHKPNLEKERKRIEKANGYIDDDRVNGMLNLTRCLGDLEYKQDKKLRQEDQILSAFPDIKIEKIHGDVDFLIIACDGIWDCMTSQQAVDYFKPKIRPVKEDKGFKISRVIEEMLDSIMAKDVESSEGIGCDNMSCLIVRFNAFK